MSWVAVAVGVGTAVTGVAGSVMSSNAARSGANAQSAAAQSASATERAAAERAEQLQREQYLNSWALLAPDARAGSRAQSYVNAILYGGRRATPAAPTGRNGATDNVWGDGTKNPTMPKPAAAGGVTASGAATRPAAVPDWAAYEAEWRPTTLNNPTSPFHQYLAQAQAADPNLTWGEAFYNWSGGIYGRPASVDYAETNDGLLDEYGDLMGDYETADLDQVMGDFRGTPMWAMTEDAIAADSAASDLATQKALQEFMHRAGASGGVLSGNALRGEAELRNEFGVANSQNAASRRQQTFGDWLDQLQGQVGIGRTARSGMVSGGANFAGAAGDLIISQGDSAARAATTTANARARASQATSDAWANALGAVAQGAGTAVYGWNNRRPNYWGTNTQAGDPPFPI